MRHPRPLALVILAGALAHCGGGSVPDGGAGDAGARPDARADATVLDDASDAPAVTDVANDDTATDARPDAPRDDGPRVDTGPCADNDGDGYGLGPGCLGPDCDDSNVEVHPGAAEACNGIDDDCNSVVDDGLGSTTCGMGACANTVQNCVGGSVQRCAPGAASAETCNGID